MYRTTNLPWKIEAPTASQNTPQKRKLSFRSVLKRSLLLALVAIFASGGWVGWKFYSNAAKLAGTSNPIKLVSSFTPSALSETNGRVNILLAGYSADDAGHAGAELTDSIMIISINPTDKSAVLISVPRDLYVNIPGYGYSKINAAYEYGEQSNFSARGYAAGGMGLLEETLSENLGVSFNYYALINYTALKEAVDAVGGVSVTIASDDSRGLYDPYTNLSLPNGTVTLTGQQALNLARARGDGYGSYGFSSGDFDRTEHQQELLVALKDKASSASVITNPFKVGELASAIGDNVKTNLTIGQIETLYTKLKGMSDSNIKTVTLNDYNGQNLLTSYTTSSGQSALIPADGVDEFGTIQKDISSLLSGSTN